MVITVTNSKNSNLWLSFWKGDSVTPEREASSAFSFPLHFQRTDIRYSQCTVTATEAMALPALLFAMHRYKPSWSLLIFFNESSELELRFSFSSSAFNQVIVGGGIPFPWQESVTLPVSFTVWSREIAAIVGETAREGNAKMTIEKAT